MHAGGAGAEKSVTLVVVAVEDRVDDVPEREEPVEGTPRRHPLAVQSKRHPKLRIVLQVYTHRREHTLLDESVARLNSAVRVQEVALTASTLRAPGLDARA
jgi:hypothetical protein